MQTFLRFFRFLRVPIYLIYPNFLLLALLCALYALADRFGFVSEISAFFRRVPGGWIILFVVVTIGVFLLTTLFHRLFNWSHTAPWIEDASSRRGGVWLLDILLVIISVGMYLLARFFYQPNLDLIFVLIISVISALVGITLAGNHHVVRGGETFADIHSALETNSFGEPVTREDLFAINNDHPLAYKYSIEEDSKNGIDDKLLVLTPGDEIRFPLGIRPGRSNRQNIRETCDQTEQDQ